MIISNPRAVCDPSLAYCHINSLDWPCSMGGSAVGSGVVEHDQGIHRDASFGIDQERIDVDRSDARAGVRHKIGKADQRLYSRRLVQRRLAAIALQLHAG